jgi:hypothetical protein
MTRIASLLLFVFLLVASGCNTLNSPSTSTTPTTAAAPSPTHTTIRPPNDEASFILSPNSSCSVVLSLAANKYLKVNYLFSPTDLGSEFIHVKYTYPEGSDVAAGGGLQRGFETQPGHPEGYYSIDFYYDVPEGAYNPDICIGIQVYVHWEVLPR